MTTDIIKEALETVRDAAKKDSDWCDAMGYEGTYRKERLASFEAALSAYEALRERVKALEEQNLHFREVLAEANNKWRHEFSEAVDEASDLLFRRLSAPQHFTRALARATLNKEDE